MSRIGRPNTVKNMLYTFLASLAFSTFSGCSNKDSNPTSPNPPGNGDDNGYVEDSGETNDMGELGLDGTLRRIRGALPLTEAAKKKGQKKKELSEN